MNRQPAITVTQLTDWDNSTSEKAVYKYRVDKALNTTMPAIGEEISKARLQELIGTLGFNVTIVGPS